MKKLAVILLLALFFFNLFGYRILFYCVQQKADIQLEASLDKEQYNEADLLTIKVPLSLPYQPGNTALERINGEINLNGKIYKYVKRGVINGEMVLLCLPDKNKMRLQAAKDDFFKYTNDLQQNTASKKSNNNNTTVFKNVCSDFDNQNENFTLASLTKNEISYLSQQASLLLTRPHTLPEQPPEAIFA